MQHLFKKVPQRGKLHWIRLYRIPIIQMPDVCHAIKGMH